MSNFRKLFFSKKLRSILSATCLVVAQVGFIMTTLMPAAAQAVGYLKLDGIITGFDAKEYKIDVDHSIYEIRSADLPPAKLAELKKKRTGEFVQLMVPMTSILSVKPLAAEDAPKQKNAVQKK